MNDSLQHKLKDLTMFKNKISLHKGQHYKGLISFYPMKQLKYWFIMFPITTLDHI